MKLYTVLASAISLPGDPAFQGDVVSEDKFNDQAHIDRLLSLKHLAPAGSDDAQKGKKAAPVRDADLLVAAQDLGIANADKMDRAALEAAVAAAGK